MKKQGGFAQIILVLVFVVVAIGTAYYFGTLKSKPSLVSVVPTSTPIVSPKPQAQVEDPTANWKTYTNSKLGISFKYPINYQIVEENSNKISFGPELFSDEDLAYLTIYTTYQTDQFLTNCVVTPNTFPCFDDRKNNGMYDIKVGNVVAKGLDVVKGVVDSNYKVVQIVNPKIEIEMYVSGGGLERTFDQILSTFKFTK